jgi:hypothetical protein
MEPEQFLQLMTGITEVKTEQAAMRRELLGNGQPGRIQILEAKVSKVELSAELLKNEAGGIRWKLGTVSALAGSAMAVVVQWLARHFFHTQ